MKRFLNFRGWENKDIEIQCICIFISTIGLIAIILTAVLLWSMVHGIK